MSDHPHSFSALTPWAKREVCVLSVVKESGQQPVTSLAEPYLFAAESYFKCGTVHNTQESLTNCEEHCGLQTCCWQDQDLMGNLELW
jgi:hypothetical protein